jgi:hypothetical protein
MDMQVDGGSRGAKHTFIGAGIPLVGALTANVSGDYQEKGGYVLTVAPIPGSLDTTTSQVFQRNAYARLNYAPSSDWSAFVGGHLFGDTRNPGSPLSYANRDQRDVSLGFNYGTYSTGTLGVRAWDGQQNERQRSTAFRAALTRAQEDSSLTAVIPSHDWGASAVWSRTGLWHMESFSVGGDFRHYQGDFNEIDFNTSGCATAPAGANCHTLARNVSSGGSQNLSGVFAQAILAPIAPLRIELTARGDRWDNNDGHSLTTIPGTAASSVSTTCPSPESNPSAGSRSRLHGLPHSRP